VIINIRGTSGTGKSTLVREIMSRYTFKDPLPGPTKKLLGYHCRLQGASDLYVVGSYLNECGGCDGIKTQEEICQRVRAWATLGDVLFEGVIVSDIFERYNYLAMDLRPQPFIFAFLDTPINLAVDRVKARRLSKGNEKVLNETNTRNRAEVHRRVFRKFQDAGRDVRWLDHTRASEQLWGWMTNDRPESAK
jgi:cytidylate kinase